MHKYNPKYLSVSDLTIKELLILLDKNALYCQGLFGSKAGDCGFLPLKDIHNNKLQVIKPLRKIKNLWILNDTI